MALRLLLALAATALALSARTALAQRPVVRGDDVWAGVTADLRVRGPWLVTATAEVRRSEGVDVPRQLFGLAGVLRDVGGGLRVGAGGALWHTSPNEDFGPARQTDERRLFAQFSGSHTRLGAGWSHRTRYEQRWIAPEPAAGAEKEWSFNARLREQVRVVVPLDGRAPASSKLYLMPNAEVFARTTNRTGVFFDQTRLAAGVGVGVSPRLNLELNLMRQSAVRADGRHEVHRVAQVTGRVLTARRR